IERLQDVRRLFLPLCNFVTLTFLRLLSRSGHRARVPYLVGSRLPSPYHFRARIQSFQAVAAPFPGASVLPSVARTSDLCAKPRPFSPVRYEFRTGLQPVPLDETGL